MPLTDGSLVWQLMTSHERTNLKMIISRVLSHKFHIEHHLRSIVLGVSSRQYGKDAAFWVFFPVFFLHLLCHSPKSIGQFWSLIVQATRFGTRIDVLLGSHKQKIKLICGLLHPKASNFENENTNLQFKCLRRESKRQSITRYSTHRNRTE